MNSLDVQFPLARALSGVRALWTTGMRRSLIGRVWWGLLVLIHVVPLQATTEKLVSGGWCFGWRPRCLCSSSSTCGGCAGACIAPAQWFSFWCARWCTTALRLPQPVKPCSQNCQPPPRPRSLLKRLRDHRVAWREFFTICFAPFRTRWHIPDSPQHCSCSHCMKRCGVMSITSPFHAPRLHEWSAVCSAARTSPLACCRND